MFGISFPHVLIYLFGVTDGWSTFRCNWLESFNETVTCCNKGRRHVWTSQNQASWSTQVSSVCCSWKKEFWYLWLVNTTKSLLTYVVHFVFHCIIMPLTFAGPLKKKCLAEFGIVTQCVAPTRVNDQYLYKCPTKDKCKGLFLFALRFESMATFVHGNYIFLIFCPFSNSWVAWIRCSKLKHP